MTSGLRSDVTRPAVKMTSDGRLGKRGWNQVGRPAVGPEWMGRAGLPEAEDAGFGD